MFSPLEFSMSTRSFVPRKAWSAVWVAILTAYPVFASGNPDEVEDLEKLVNLERAEACAEPSRLEQCQYLSSFLEAGLPSLAPLVLLTGEMHTLRSGPRNTPTWQQDYLVVAADEQGHLTYLFIAPETEREAEPIRAELSDANKRNEKDSAHNQIRQHLARLDKEYWLVPEKFSRTLAVQPVGQAGVLAIRRGPDGFYAFLLARQPKMRSSFDLILVGHVAKLQLVGLSRAQ